MNQISQIPFGSDATKLAGYAQATGDRLGAFDVVFENTGQNDAYIFIAEGKYTPSGLVYETSTPIVPGFTVRAGGGVVTKSMRSLNKRVGFFGSGNTLVNATVVIRNKGDLRGAQIDIVTGGRRGWGYDPAFDSKTTRANWGPPPDAPTSPAIGEVG
jgi:hypothetical protein